jgi:glucose/arabinose dehydrogenase
MARFTGLTALDWAVVFAAFGSLAFVVQARRPIGGGRALGFSVAPAVTGAVLVAVIAAKFSDTFERLSKSIDRPATLVVLVAALAVAFIVVDFLITRVLPLLRFDKDGPVGTGEQVALFVGLGVLGFGALLLAADRVEDRREAVRPVTTTTILPATTTTGPKDNNRLPLGLRLVATHELSGSPVGMVVDEERGLGYMTFAEGRIVRFTLSNLRADSWEPVTVVEGLEYPRGVTIAGDDLVIAELGPLPCPDPVPRCRGEHIVEESWPEGEVILLEGSSGRLTAFTIDGSGGLIDRRVLLEGLPVVDTDHGINGVTAGPDGSIYVSVGNFNRLDLYPELSASVEHPHKDWIGTVLRVSRDGQAAEVFASGLRNTFQLAFAPDGSLWGVDNDGQTRSGGWRREEVLQIREGDEFGFPVDATFGVPSVRTRGPVWIAETVGSAGTAWASDAGLESTLVLGSCGLLHGLELTYHDGEWLVADRSDYVEIMKFHGCAAAIAIVSPDLVLVAVNFREGGGALYVLRVPVPDA